MVKTVVQPKSLSSYMLDVPALPTVEQVTVSVPVLQLPGVDSEPTAAAAAASTHLEVGAAGMLQVRRTELLRYQSINKSINQST